MKSLRHRLMIPYLLVILAFLYVPIIVLMVYSFNESRINAVWTGWTFDWYLSLFENRQVLHAFTNSIIVATISTIISTVLGTAAAIALQRKKIRFRGAVDGLIYLPVIIPEVVMGLSLLILFSQINQFIQFPLGKLTIIIAHITFSISFVVIIVSARLEGMGQQLEEAAQDLGANRWQTFRYVTLPIILPGIVAGALVAFTLSIDDFVISYFVAGPNSTTLPLQIYGMVKRGITPEINALSTILILLTILLVIASELFRRKGASESAKKHIPF